jgi:hypothetical protein|tara:strand:+ start:1186 stop:1422 length:237 start_codon:yes stop_codon:yes gene_type:complete
MRIQVKDRVKLIDPTRKGKKDEGTIVKLYRGKNNKIKTAGVLWDGDWPRAVDFNPRLQPGRVFYYKPEDLKIIDTWRI